MILSRKEMQRCRDLMPGIDCGEGDRLIAPPDATREQTDSVLRYVVAYRWRRNNRMDAFRLALGLRRLMRTGEAFPEQGQEGAL